MNCDQAFEAISAAVDGELVDDDGTVRSALDEHLAGCAECSGFQHYTVELRARLRFEAVDATPDVAPAVVALLVAEAEAAAAAGDDEPVETGRRAFWQRPRAGGAGTGPGRSRAGAGAGRRRTGEGPGTKGRPLLAAAAALVAGMVVGAAFVGLGQGSSSPAWAEDLPEEVVQAQHDITSLDARISVVEHGRPDHDGPRSFEGRLSYQAPERLALTLTETGSPGRSAEGDVRLLVRDDSWWLSTVRSCAAFAGQTSCPPEGSAWTQEVTGREAFSDAAPIPLELIGAVDSFTLAAAPPVLGERRIAGRTAVGVRVSAAQVARFLDALSPGDDLRAVHPSDPVDVWLDHDDLVPLAVEVHAGRSDERAKWATAHDYRDQPGDTVLAFAVESISVNDGTPDDAFEWPDDGSADAAEASDPAASERTESRPTSDGETMTTTVAPAPADDPREIDHRTVRDDGFRPGRADMVPEPADLPDGMEPHLSGTIQAGNGPVIGVRSWTDGRAWVKVRATDGWDGTRLFGELGPAVRTTSLGRAGQGYVSADGRKIALHTDRLDVVVCGSLPTEQLRDIASSLDVVGQPVPPTWPESATATLEQARAAQPGLLVPRHLQGFGPPAVGITGGSVSQLYVGPGDRAFTLTRSGTPVLAPPSGDDSLWVEVRNTAGRYSVDRGELEWTEDGASYSLQSPTVALSELLAISDVLSPA